MCRIRSYSTYLTAVLVLLDVVAPALAEAASPLGALPTPGGYFNIGRLLMVLACFLIWCVFCQWTNKDLEYLYRLNREMWNQIVLGSGVVGLGAWIALPWTSPALFWAGFALWLVVTAGGCSIYVITRNGLVDPAARVFTPRHIRKRLTGGRGRNKDDGLDSVERVRLSNNKGSRVSGPDNSDEAAGYDACQNLLFDAFWRRATEVELLVASNGARLAYRIDGVVTPRNDLLDRDSADNSISFIKKIAGLNPEERRRPQEGSMSGSISGMDGGLSEVEVRTSGTTQHERLSLKIVGAENRLRISDLGMSTKQQEQFEQLAAKPSGLMVVSGPRSGGLTTTLYAALRSHDAFMSNLLTLEYAPLMELENVTQHIFDTRKHEASYARQLQSILRREPDVVIISDCPDRETAHLAARAAIDGKKVYMGIQARDGFDALKKLVSLAGDTEAVADALLAIVSQRLIRKLCIACRQAYKPDQQQLKKANLPANKIEHFYRPPPEGLVDAKGNPIVCSNCQGSGYFGRTGVFELLVFDDNLRDLIRKGQPVTAVKAQSRKSGMLYLEEVGLQKVIEGVTSMNELLRILRAEAAGAAKAKKGGG